MLELNQAWRRLLAAPTFSAFAILSIGLGVGVPTAIYAAVAGVLWPPTNVRSPETLFVVTSEGSSARRTFGAISAADFESLRALNSAESCATGEFFQTVQFPDRLETVRGEAISDRYVQVLGIVPSVGAWPYESGETSVAPVMISHELWRTRLRGHPQVLGMALKLGSQHFNVVAVAPKGFAGIRPPGIPPTSVWITLRDHHARIPEPTPSHNRSPLTVLTRLRPGASASILGAEIGTVATRLEGTERTTVPLRETARRWHVLAIGEAIAESVGGAVRVAYLAFGLLFMVFAVACTTLANLTWSRAVQRREEFAIRRALGASVRQLSVTTISESSLLAVAGGLAAYILFHSLKLLLTMDLPFSATHSVRIEPQLTNDVLAVGATALAVALLIFGVEPGTHAAKLSARTGLSTNGSAATPRTRKQDAFVRWQVGICTALLLIGVMCGRAALNTSARDTGIPIEDLFVGRIDFSAYGTTEAAAAVAREAVLSSLARRVGERRAALTTGMPFGVVETPLAAVTSLDRPFRPYLTYSQALVLSATTEVFETLGLEITHGRELVPADYTADPVNVVISARTAKTLFGTQEALGKQFVYQLWRSPDGRGQAAKTAAVAGVMSDTDVVRFGSDRTGLIVLPLKTHYRPELVISVNKANAPELTTTAIINTVRMAAPTAVVSRMTSGWTGLAPQHTVIRAVGMVAMALTVLTTTMVMIGLYAIQAQAVATRIRENGVRAALGATPTQIRKLVLRGALVPVTQGIGVALIAAAAGRTALKAIVPLEFSIIEPVLFTMVSVPLLLIAAAAAWPAANAAARADPIVALRQL